MTYFIYYRTSVQNKDRDNYYRRYYDDPEYIWGESLDDIKEKISAFINERATLSANDLINQSCYNYDSCITKLEHGRWPETLAENGLEFITPIFYIDDEIEDVDYTEIFRSTLHKFTLEKFKLRAFQEEDERRKALENKEIEERLLLEKLLKKYPRN